MYQILHLTAASRHWHENDPAIEEDCRNVMQFYQNTHVNDEGHGRMGINSIEAVRMKHEVHGPNPRFCTRSGIPYGHMFLIFLPKMDCDVLGADSGVRDRETFIGAITMCFREEMPCPDLGWGIFTPFRNQGYASEAAKRALDWWRDEVGVKEIFCGITDENIPSIKCAQRTGFVEGGPFDIKLGSGNDIKVLTGKAYVLPGMQWKGLDEHGQRVAMLTTIGIEAEDELNQKVEASTAALMEY